jgi:hypothetical protein
MSYYAEVYVAFIFIVPLIFIALLPFNFSVKHWVRNVHEILHLSFSLLHLNSNRDVAYHETFPKEGRYWVFCPGSFKKTNIIFLPYSGDLLWCVSSL